MVKLNNKSKFVKKDLPFDNCLVEKCSPMKEEEIEEEELEKEEEDNSINNLFTEQFQNNNSQKINITFTSQKGFTKNVVAPRNMKVKDLFIKYKQK